MKHGRAVLLNLMEREFPTPFCWSLDWPRA